MQREEHLTVKKKKSPSELSFIEDYRLAYLSRQLSILGRKEVLSGKAKFGVFGDGKELAQIAYAKNFKKGDWRSGYYRDQTFMMALGILSPVEFFSQLYGETDELVNPMHAGRNFNNHFATANIDRDGNLIDLAHSFNSASDISPTAGQMPRLLGLAYASKLFRNNKELSDYKKLSEQGNEVAFGSIGDGATSEGLFFETINAACVLQVPLSVAVYDDGYAISVPVALQTAKSSISEALRGFEMDDNTKGCKIYVARGWDYLQLLEVFREGIEICRAHHIPIVFHITEMVQPSGHSTSGSHERYKSKERLDWEKEHDPLIVFRKFLLDSNMLNEESIKEIEEDAKAMAANARKVAWEKYIDPISRAKFELIDIIDKLISSAKLNIQYLNSSKEKLSGNVFHIREILSVARRLLVHLKYLKREPEIVFYLDYWIQDLMDKGKDAYSRFLYAEKQNSALNTDEWKPAYNENAEWVSGVDILNKNFHLLFKKYPLLVTFGEDTGKLGDVNMGMRNMQQVNGDLRVTDTGIREATIIGQGIGLALRGFRPIAEIQYLDYINYALTTLSDDLAITHYRTKGLQIAPVIVRTRGHRLEGIWHSGSPMAMLLSTIRGMHLCVPRNMTQAAGMYNTLLESNEPAIVIEPLKAYQVKEPMPINLGEFRISLGKVEVLKEGNDISLVTYGWCVSIAQEAIKILSQYEIDIELIDVQCLLPFDITHEISKSLIKTNHLVILDEDVPGGASAYILKHILEEQGAFDYLDYPPMTITGKDHRPAYGSDGDYFSKPSVEDVVEKILLIMSKRYPGRFDSL